MENRVNVGDSTVRTNNATVSRLNTQNAVDTANSAANVLYLGAQNGSYLKISKTARYLQLLKLGIIILLALLLFLMQAPPGIML